MHRREMALLQRHFTARPPGAEARQGSAKWDMASTDSRASTVVGTGVHYIGEVYLGLAPGDGPSDSDYSSLLCHSSTTMEVQHPSVTHDERASFLGSPSEIGLADTMLEERADTGLGPIAGASVLWETLAPGNAEPALDIIPEGD
jgi:hypothetical protein